jgi:hypothetical protein
MPSARAGVRLGELYARRVVVTERDEELVKLAARAEEGVQIPRIAGEAATAGQDACLHCKLLGQSVPPSGGAGQVFWTVE